MPNLSICPPDYEVQHICFIDLAQLGSEQWNNHQLLIEQLTKRVIPVQDSTHSESFVHDRQQKPKETIDEYANAPMKLFAKAYSERPGG